MKVHFQLTGPVIAPAHLDREGAQELPEGTTVSGLLQHLGFRKEQLRFFRVARGEEVAVLSTVLHDGDNVTVMLPIGGG